MAEPAESPNLQLAGTEAEPRGSWWRLWSILQGVVAGGAWAAMGASEQATYVALLSYADRDTLEAYPSVDRLARDTGIAGRSIKRALSALVDRGAIERVRRGNGREAAVYRITPSERESAGGDGLAVTGCDSARVRPDQRLETPASAEAKGTSVSPQGGHTCHPRGDINGTPPGANDRAPMTSGAAAGVRAGQAERPPAADREPMADEGLFDRHEVVGDLLDRGFGERDAWRLLRDHGLGRIRDGLRHCDLWQRLGEIRSSYRGRLVSWLRDGHARDPRVDETPGERADRVSGEAEADAEEAAAKTDAAVDGMLWQSQSAEQIEAHRRAVLAELPLPLARMHAHKPATSPWLRGSIVKRIAEGATDG